MARERGWHRKYKTHDGFLKQGNFLGSESEGYVLSTAVENSTQDWDSNSPFHGRPAKPSGHTWQLPYKTFYIKIRLKLDLVIQSIIQLPKKFRDSATHCISAWHLCQREVRWIFWAKVNGQWVKVGLMGWNTLTPVIRNSRLSLSIPPSPPIQCQIHTLI